MPNVRISDRTALEDVLKWRLSDGDTIRVGRHSGFEPGAQGIALSVLAALAPGENEVNLVCDFEEPASEDHVQASIFSTSFGFALVRLTRSITFAGQPASAAFKPLLSAVYKTSGGVLGIGTMRSVVCPDPTFPLPPSLLALGDDLGAEGFPPPSTFAAFLRNVVGTLGFRQLLASAEETDVISFVYESLRNSLEHGICANARRRTRSTRALIVEKVVLQSSDLPSRRLSPDLKAYLERIAESSEGALGLGVACLTVADQGDGIQFTLPARAGETPESRFERAFTEGESRKPSGTVNRGLGLPKVVSAAHRLKALIRITSGELSLVEDFSTGEHKYPKLNFANVTKLNRGIARGTVVSIFLPEYRTDLDQISLFRRRPL